MKITILNRNNCKGEDQETIDWLRSVLQYPSIWYKRGPFKSEPVPYTKYLVDTKGRFVAGFIPKIIETAEIQKKTILWSGTDKLNGYLHTVDPLLPTITFRDDQKRLIANAISKKRGILKAPTRTGKTVIAAGIISALKQPKTLFLVHTLDLWEQTEEEFKKFGFNVGMMGGGRYEPNADVTIATRQTFVNRITSHPIHFFDLVIVDEAHHAIDFDGQYGQILQHLQPAFKLGFTATMPEKEGDKLVMEGLIGPMIGEVTQEEATELDLLAETKVRICKVPKDPLNSGITTYKRAYPELVVMKRSRNKLIMNIAKEYLDKNETVLIIVRRVQHGFYIQDMFKTFMPNLEVPFLCGGIDSESRGETDRVFDLINIVDQQLKYSYGKERDKQIARKEQYTLYRSELKKLDQKVKENSKKRGEYKEKLNNREIKCIIATNIWNEGVNIPTLNTIILAGAGKSETQTIQSGSRAFTKSERKDYGTLVDLFDPNYSTFIEHFGHRISMYCELGWM